MQYFKVVLNGGHMGAGRSCEIVTYLEASDFSTALRMASRAPGAKKGYPMKGVSSLARISRKEFLGSAAG